MRLSFFQRSAATSHHADQASPIQPESQPSESAVKVHEKQTVRRKTPDPLEPSEPKTPSAESPYFFFLKSPEIAAEKANLNREARPRTLFALTRPLNAYQRSE